MSITRDELKALVETAAAKTASRKAFNMTNEGAEAPAEETEKMTSVKFFKALADGERDSLKSFHALRAKDLNEGTGTAGGYLVPEEFEKEVIRLMDDYNQIRVNSTVLPMGSDVKRLNALASDVTAYKPSEGAQITASDPVFGEPVLTAQKYAGITAWSNELAMDAEANVISLLAERFAMAIAKLEQNDFLNDTTSGSEGIMVVSGTDAVGMASGDTSFADASWDYLRNLLVAAEERSIAESRNGKFYMHPSVWNLIAQTKPTGATYYGSPVPTADTARSAWGHEVVLVNEMPAYPTDDAVSTGFIVFSDLRKHNYIGDRMGLKVDILREGTVGSTNLAEQDSEAIRVVKRTAHVTALQDGIHILTTAAV